MKRLFPHDDALPPVFAFPLVLNFRLSFRQTESSSVDGPSYASNESKNPRRINLNYLSTTTETLTPPRQLLRVPGSGARQRRTIPDEYAFKREKIRVAHKERVARGSSSKEKGFRESVEGQLSGISKVLKEFAIKMKKNKKKKKKQRDQRRGRLNSNDRKYHKP
ncbi:hypothetical protein RUM44_004974 [Polyplax serrata]|uniref:Uncharacterized protein n=1 Tax=Polyplax serrata TaxID=468196 RepID=A0ABR1AY39_POLSC